MRATGSSSLVRRRGGESGASCVLTALLPPSAAGMDATVVSRRKGRIIINVVLSLVRDNGIYMRIEGAA